MLAPKRPRDDTFTVSSLSDEADNMGFKKAKLMASVEDQKKFIKNELMVCIVI